MGRVTIAVAVATMDRPEGLERCVAALLTGESRPDELLIIDQGNEAATQPIIERFRIAGTPIRHISQRARGLSASRNAALASFTSDVLAVTDDDCVPDCCWLAAIRGVFDSAESPDALTGRVLPLGDEMPGTYAVASRISNEAVRYHSRQLPWLVGTGANFVISRSSIQRIGKYDERLGAGSPGRAGEDMDIIFRLLRSGACIAYEPAAIILHERQPVSRRRRTRFFYGHGIGAFCGLWLRRDAYVVNVAARWVLLRMRLLWRAVLRTEWGRVLDEAVVLRGTVQGFLYGVSR